MIGPVFSALHGGRPLQARFFAMGTVVSVTLIAARGHEAAARAAISDVEQYLQQFGRDAWAWGSGALAEFNRALCAGQRVAIPLQLHSLFRRAWQIRQWSEGRFEPRIGSLVKLWSFHDAEHLRDEPPAANSIRTHLEQLRTAPAYDGGSFYGPAPGIAWDFGGIGKGYIVDRALARFVAAGFRHVSIDAGGNLAVRGRYKHRRWHTGIRDPRSADAHAPQLLAHFDIEDEAVITHGDDQRGFEYKGQRYGHLLDPRSGWPAQGLRALTVVHTDAALADAAGGALYVAGPQHWPALAQRLGIDQVLALNDDGSLVATPQLAARLRLRSDLRLHVR